MYKIKRTDSPDDFVWGDEYKTTFKLLRDKSEGMTVEDGDVEEVVEYFNNFNAGKFVAIEE